MAWNIHGAASAVRQQANDQAGHIEFKDKVWSTFMSQAVDETDGAASLLHRPDYAPPGGTTMMMMQPHIPDVGTGAYDDVEKCLAMIHKVKVDGKGLKIVYVFGDQQVPVKNFNIYAYFNSGSHANAYLNHHTHPPRAVIQPYGMA